MHGFMVAIAMAAKHGTSSASGLRLAGLSYVMVNRMKTFWWSRLPCRLRSGLGFRLRFLTSDSCDWREFCITPLTRLFVCEKPSCGCLHLTRHRICLLKCALTGDLPRSEERR